MYSAVYSTDGTRMDNLMQEDYLDECKKEDDGRNLDIMNLRKNTLQVFDTFYSRKDELAKQDNLLGKEFDKFMDENCNSNVTSSAQILSNQDDFYSYVSFSRYATKESM